MYYLLEGVELWALGVDIILVDLVSHQEELLLVGKLDDIFNVLFWQHLQNKQKHIL